MQGFSPDAQLEYKYWGKYGPKQGSILGVLFVLVTVPLLILVTVALIATVLALIAVPPLGIACVKAVCS
jgi:hypothetical protein